MKENDETRHAAGTPEERISWLCAALARTTASLDLETERLGGASPDEPPA